MIDIEYMSSQSEGQHCDTVFLRVNCRRAWRASLVKSERLSDDSTAGSDQTQGDDRVTLTLKAGISSDFRTRQRLIRSILSVLCNNWRLASS